MPDGPPKPIPTSPRSVVATEHLWKTLQAINEWTRFADAKAAAILTANGVLGGLVAGLIDKKWASLKANQPLKVALLTGGLALLVSSIACVKCLFPRRNVEGAPRSWLPRWPIPGRRRSPPSGPGGVAPSLLFFHHIADHAGPDAFLADARSLGDPEVAFREVGGQVWANARVAREKHDEVGVAIGLTGLSLGAAFVAWILALLSR